MKQKPQKAFPRRAKSGPEKLPTTTKVPMTKVWSTKAPTTKVATTKARRNRRKGNLRSRQPLFWHRPKVSSNTSWYKELSICLFVFHNLQLNQKIYFLLIGQGWLGRVSKVQKLTTHLKLSKICPKAKIHPPGVSY